MIVMEIISRKEAQQRGLPRYYTGKPCKHGHICERYAVGSCVECSNIASKAKSAYKKRWYNENKERCAELGKERYKRNKNDPDFQRKSKQYREITKLRKSEYDRKYRNIKGEELLEQKRKYTADPKNKKRKREYDKKYREKNRDKINANKAFRAYSKKKRTPSWLTDEDKEEIKLIYFIRQMASDYSNVDYHVDHIIPLIGITVSGLHVPGNLQILEASQNCSKKNKY